MAFGRGYPSEVGPHAAETGGSCRGTSNGGDGCRTRFAANDSSRLCPQPWRRTSVEKHDCHPAPARITGRLLLPHTGIEDETTRKTDRTSFAARRVETRVVRRFP